MELALKIIIAVLLVIAAYVVWAMIAWRDEMKEWPRPEDCEPKSDDNYCGDMDAQ